MPTPSTVLTPPVFHKKKQKCRQFLHAWQLLTAFGLGPAGLLSSPYAFFVSHSVVAHLLLAAAACVGVAGAVCTLLAARRSRAAGLSATVAVHTGRLRGALVEFGQLVLMLINFVASAQVVRGCVACAVRVLGLQYESLFQKIWPFLVFLTFVFVRSYQDLRFPAAVALLLTPVPVVLVIVRALLTPAADIELRGPAPPFKEGLQVLAGAPFAMLFNYGIATDVGARGSVAWSSAAVAAAAAATWAAAAVLGHVGFSLYRNDTKISLLETFATDGAGLEAVIGSITAALSHTLRATVLAVAIKKSMLELFSVIVPKLVGGSNDVEARFRRILLDREISVLLAAIFFFSAENTHQNVAFIIGSALQPLLSVAVPGWVLTKTAKEHPLLRKTGKITCASGIFFTFISFVGLWSSAQS